MGKPILFCCPSTGQNVQGHLTVEPPADGSRQYEALECLSCRRFHLVNVSTGKLLSDESDDGQPEAPFLGKASNRRRHAIGRFGIISLADARAEAKRLLAEQTPGHDKPRTITFTTALELFEEQKYPALKPRTVKD